MNTFQKVIALDKSIAQKFHLFAIDYLSAGPHILNQGYLLGQTTLPKLFDGCRYYQLLADDPVMKEGEKIVINQFQVIIVDYTWRLGFMFSV